MIHYFGQNTYELYSASIQPWRKNSSMLFWLFPNAIPQQKYIDAFIKTILSESFIFHTDKSIVYIFKNKN